MKIISQRNKISDIELMFNFIEDNFLCIVPDTVYTLCELQEQCSSHMDFLVFCDVIVDYMVFIYDHSHSKLPLSPGEYHLDIFYKTKKQNDFSSRWWIYNPKTGQVKTGQT